MENPSKKVILDFLNGHFRYWTMNCWNGSKSYAAKVKLYDFVPKELMDQAFGMVDMPEVYAAINFILQEFAERYEYRYQIGFNGRSSGYMVLYQGGRKNPGYKARCNYCGKLTWYETEQSCKVSGCAGMLKKLTAPVYETYTQPGKSMPDQDYRDIEDWDYEALYDLYQLIQDFDLTVESCKQEFLYYCQNAEIVEEEIFVPKKIKTLSLV